MPLLISLQSSYQYLLSYRSAIRHPVPANSAYRGRGESGSGPSDSGLSEATALSLFRGQKQEEKTAPVAHQIGDVCNNLSKTPTRHYYQELAARARVVVADFTTPIPIKASRIIKLKFINMRKRTTVAGNKCLNL